MAEPVPSSDDLDALLAQIASRTEALRRDGGTLSGDTARLLLAELTRAAARLRIDATAIGESLAGALDSGRPAPDKPREQP